MARYARKSHTSCCREAALIPIFVRSFSNWSFDWTGSVLYGVSAGNQFYQIQQGFSGDSPLSGSGRVVGASIIDVTQDLLHLTRPCLPLFVQVPDALQVTEQMSSALTHPGKRRVELVPAGVVVADQVAAPVLQYTQGPDRL